jgi:hypothetical protein
MIRVLPFATMMFLVASLPMQAALLLQTPSFPLATPVPDKVGIIGYVALVDVGATPVAYNQIGVFGQVLGQLDMKFFIAPEGGAPVTLSQATLAVESSPSWHLSDVLGVAGTLNANTTYYVGFATDGGSYQSNFASFSPADFTQNGLTQRGRSGQVSGTFAVPTVPPGGLSDTQFAIQIFGPDQGSAAVPEPATYVLLAIGLLAIAIKRP